MTVSIVVAHTDDLVIGNNNELPWYIPEDLKHFKKLTEGHAVIMGRNTYDSIIARISKPLPNRTNVVVSSTLDDPRVTVVKSIDDAISAVSNQNEIFIIGGNQIYRDFLQRNLVNKMYITKVHGNIDGDTYFPEYNEKNWVKTSTKESNDSKYTYEFIEYERR